MEIGTIRQVDRPETHLVRKDGMYYAFYTLKRSGQITLRGISQRACSVKDYVDGIDLGTVRGPTATLDVRFEKHLLVQAKPE